MSVEIPESELAGSRRNGLLRHLGITAGVFDAAMSSLATFLGGLVAANILGDRELGIYAVFFAAFNFGQVIANNLIYIPAEVVAVGWERADRTGILLQSIPIGVLPSFVGSLPIGLAAIITFQMADSSIVIPLTITAGLTTLLWPTQDHIRRMLHIAERSWLAAGVSSAHFVVTAIAIGLMLGLHVSDAWIPFGALACANAVSLGFGLAMARPTAAPRHVDPRLRIGSLTKSGRWLAIGVGVPTVTAFGAATIISFLAGPEALGFAEAARIAAHPILVLGTGLGYVLGPRVMRGAIDRNRAASRHNHRRFLTVLAAAAVGYALLFGWDWVGNPMSFLVSDAYVVEWLVIATVGANILMAAIVLVLQELTAAGKTRTIARVSVFSAVFQLLAAATAGLTQAFARPISLVVGNGARLYGTSRAIGDIYASDNSN